MSWVVSDGSSAYVPLTSLSTYFAQLGSAAAPFLQSIATGTNRVLARHAAWFIDELKFSDPVAEFRGFFRSLKRAMTQKQSGEKCQESFPREIPLSVSVTSLNLL